MNQTSAPRTPRGLFAGLLATTLLPMLVLAVVLLEGTARQRAEESRLQLQESATRAAESLRLRLRALVGELRQLRHDLPSEPDAQLRRSFQSLGIRDGHRYRDLLGSRPDSGASYDLHAQDIQGFAADLPLLSYEHDGSSLRPILVLPLQPGEVAGPLLEARPRAHQLFGGPGLRPREGHWLLLDRQGRLLCSNHPQRPETAVLTTLLQSGAIASDLRLFRQAPTQIAALAPVELHGTRRSSWFLVHARDAATVRAQTLAWMPWLLAGMLATGLVVALLILLLLRRFLRPLGRLQVLGDRLASGAPCPDIPAFKGSPFAGLAASLQTLQAQRRTDQEQRDRTAAQLAEHRGEALAASQQQSRFLTSISHELRTPLTGILSFTELLRDPETGDDPRTREEFLGILHEQATNLHGMIENLLRLAAIESGTASWQDQALDLGLSIKRSVDACPAQERGRIQLALPSTSIQVCGDPAHLDLVWTQLLDNACKFSPADRPVQIRAEIDTRDCVVEVRDQGPGIAQADRERIFERFEQAHNDPLTDKHPGAGLGLALVRDILRRLGGQVRVSRSDSNGTTFRLRLPLWDPRRHAAGEGLPDHSAEPRSTATPAPAPKPAPARH